LVDYRSNSYVALKILVANITETPNELKILQYLAQAAGPRVSEHIIKFLDMFKHTSGPNGSHYCLVFELMGPSVNNMVESLPCFKPPQSHLDMTVRYPVWMARRILKQTLQVLVFLHQNGFAHGDLQPGNILFTLKDLKHVDDNKVHQDGNYKWGSISPPVQRKDGKIDKWAPTYLAVPQPLDELADISPQFKIKLSDLGGGQYFYTLLPLLYFLYTNKSVVLTAFLISDPPKTIITPLGLKPPELFISGIVDKTLDTWSFRCLVFELIIGQPLFDAGWYTRIPEAETDGYLLMLSDILGPLPENIYTLWARSSKYYTSERVQFNSFLSKPPDGTDLLSAKRKPLEEFFDANKPDDLSNEEANIVKALLRRILQYDPAKRPAPFQILQDPWFTGLSEAGSLEMSVSPIVKNSLTDPTQSSL
jgi:serine/threonine protein kinase